MKSVAETYFSFYGHHADGMKGLNRMCSINKGNR